MIDIDQTELEEELLRAVARVFLPHIQKDTPMNEVREITEAMGVVAGRVIASALHKGPINTEILIEMRRYEKEMVDKHLNACKLYGPGGAIRQEMDD